MIERLAMSSKTYSILNYILAGVIVAIFIYAAISSQNNCVHPKCIHDELLGKRCPTCGLMQGFSSILKGRIHEAYHIQRNSLRIFLLLLIQLLIRISALLVVKKYPSRLKVIMRIDVITTSFLVIVVFINIIPQVFYIYYKMLLTGS